MKYILTVFMFVIGMMANTVSATTTTLDKKEKTTIYAVALHTTVGHVVIALYGVTFQYTAINPEPQVQSFANQENTKKNTEAIINDVGWNSVNIVSHNYIYKNRLCNKNLLDHSRLFKSKGLKLNRSNC